MLLAELLVYSLAVFGVSYVLVYLDGPYSVFDKLRANLPVVNCLACLSFWMCLALMPVIGVINALAVWGGAILMDRLAR